MPAKRMHYSDAEWEELILRCKSSGQSDWQWCHENDISPSSFYRHLKKFRHTEIIPVPGDMVLDQDLASRPQEVVPLVIREKEAEQCTFINETASPAVRLTVHGVTLEVFNNAGSEVLSNLLRAVAQSC